MTLLAVALGDSITASSPTPDPDDLWAAIVAAGIGATLNNHALASSQAADQAYLAAATLPPLGANIGLVFLGVNDVTYYGADPIKQQAFGAHHLAALVHLSCGEIVPAQDMSKTGTWTVYSPEGGAHTPDAGGKATFSVEGDVAYVCFRNQNNNESTGAVSEIKIGNVTKGSRTGNGQTIGNTFLGQSYAPQVKRIAGLGPLGSHLLDIVNAVGGKYTLLDYGAGPLAQTDNPHIFVLNIPVRNPDVAWRADYNAIIAANVAALRADGRNVHLIDITNVITVGNLVDGIHWDTAGHAAVAAKVIAVWNALPPPTITTRYTSAHGATTDIVTDAETGVLLSQTTTF